jgi:hypothetical protein
MLCLVWRQREIKWTYSGFLRWIHSDYLHLYVWLRMGSFLLSISLRDENREDIYLIFFDPLDKLSAWMPTSFTFFLLPHYLSLTSSVCVFQRACKLSASGDVLTGRIWCGTGRHTGQGLQRGGKTSTSSSALNRCIFGATETSRWGYFWSHLKLAVGASECGVWCITEHVRCARGGCLKRVTVGFSSGAINRPCGQPWPLSWHLYTCAHLLRAEKHTPLTCIH